MEGKCTLIGGGLIACPSLNATLGYNIFICNNARSTSSPVDSLCPDCTDTKGMYEVISVKRISHLIFTNINTLIPSPYRRWISLGFLSGMNHHETI
jgi:hypothetical protein